jgi:hypothetical protein
LCGTVRRHDPGRKHRHRPGIARRPRGARAHGLITGTAAQVNFFGFAAISALVGLFSPEAADKLKQIFSTLFAPSRPGRDALAPDPAAAGRVTRPGTSGDPDHGTGGPA